MGFRAIRYCLKHRDLFKTQLRAILRASAFGDVKINTSNRTVLKNGRIIPLAQKEFDLLVFMCSNKNTALTKEKLISEVWGAFSEVEPSTLTVHIRWLREKLEDDPANPRYIKTVWRLGYMIADTK